MALVREHQRVVRHVFEQRRRRLARLAAGEIARVVLDAGAAAGRLHHLEVVDGALLQPLRLQEPPGGVQLIEPPLQFLLDAGDRLQQRRPRRHVVRVGVDLDEFQLVGLVAGERIELVDRFDLVAEQRHPPGAVLVVGGKHLDHVAAHAEAAAVEIAGRPFVLQRHQVGDQLALVDALALLERERHRRVGLDRADTVDARHRGDDDDVVALQQRARGGVAHAVDLLVDRGFLLDIGVGARDVGFRLVVVVVADEVFDCVVGKEALELAVELRGERLVGRQHQRRALRRLDHLRHGEGLARAGDAEQHLGAVAALDAFDQVGDRLRLVALRCERRLDHQRLPALGLLRPRRPVRRPRPLGELGAALAQQLLQRLRRRHHAGFGGGAAGLGARRALAADVGLDRCRQRSRGREGGFGLLVILDAERARQVRVERPDLGAVAGLRRLAESSRAVGRRFARAVGGGEVGAAVERVVGRRLQTGLRAGPGGALVDPRIEQLLQRRRDRRQLRPRRLGARRLYRLLLGCASLGRVFLRMLGRVARTARAGRFLGRHPGNMRLRPRRGKGGADRGL